MPLPNLEISTERSRLDVELVHRFLSRTSYWAKGRSRAVVERSLANSLCFGAYVAGLQIGFGRVITDYAVLGYLADIFVVADFRGQGVGTALVKAMLDHPDVSGLQVVLLRAADDARSLYARFGFDAVPRPDEMMVLYRNQTPTNPT